MTYKKNLIEVALLLDVINKASVRAKWSQRKIHSQELW
jgi:hypothetical protein